MAPQLIGIILPEFATPLTDGFVGHVDAAFTEQLLHVVVAQGKMVVESDSRRDDCTGKA
jgi:hypothetical protein